MISRYSNLIDLGRLTSTILYSKVPRFILLGLVHLLLLLHNLIPLPYWPDTLGRKNRYDWIKSWIRLVIKSVRLPYLFLTLNFVGHTPRTHIFLTLDWRLSTPTFPHIIHWVKESLQERLNHRLNTLSFYQFTAIYIEITLNFWRKYIWILLVIRFINSNLHLF